MAALGPGVNGMGTPGNLLGLDQELLQELLTRVLGDGLMLLGCNTARLWPTQSILLLQGLSEDSAESGT